MVAAWFEFQGEQGPETGGFRQNGNMQHSGAKSGMHRGDFPKACWLLNSASSARNLRIHITTAMAGETATEFSGNSYRL